MRPEEIDKLWNRALLASVAAGEQFTRYRFAALVRAAVLNECEQACINLKPPHPMTNEAESWWDVGCLDCADAIAKLGQKGDE